MADSKLIIKPPHMQVRMKPGYWPDLPRMLQTIRQAGYQPIPEKIELRVRGKVVRRGDALGLEVSGMKTPVLLPITPAPEEPETAAHLERHVTQEVELEGSWKPADAGAPGTLAVTLILK